MIGVKKFFPFLFAVMLCIFCFNVNAAEAAEEESESTETEIYEEFTTEFPTETEEETTAVVISPEEETTAVVTEPEEETTVIAEPKVSYLAGDINADGKTSASDARAILRYSVGINEIESSNIPAADVSLDGKITANDARLSLRMSVGLETAFSTDLTVTVEKEPTCSEEGKLVFGTDEKEFSLKLVKKPHSFSVKESKKATCTKTGFLHEICDICKTENKEIIPQLKHNFKTVKSVKATCTKDGLEHTVCSLCKLEKKEVLPKLNHKWQAATSTTPTTCLNCSMKKTGWEKVNGKYYYFKKVNNDVVLAVNCIVDNYYVDKTGVRVDDATVKAAVAFVNKYSKATDDNKTRLKSCFNVLCRFPYVTMYGKPTAKDMPACALYMFNNRQGNCYRYSAAFAYVARVLGFDSRVVIGKVLGTYGYMTSHSYTQVKIDGLWYICDGSKHGRYTSKNWYMVTKATYPNRFDVEQYTSFEIKDGKVYWS